MNMAISSFVVLGLLLNYIHCLPDTSSNTTAINKIQDDIADTSDDAVLSINNKNESESVTFSEMRNEISKIVSNIQPDRIKEDDKNGSEHQNVENETSTVLTESSSNDYDTKQTRGGEGDTIQSDNPIVSSSAPFSPSPYLGTVIEEVIEEPIAQHRDSKVLTDFIPMKSRQSLNSFIEDTPLGRQYPAFYTASTVIPVLGDSYALHATNAINEDFDNPNFNENPFGRIRFPEEKSKYFPLYLNENDIDDQEKPLKFDHEGNYKQYDFPYKIENTGYNAEEVQKEPNVLDKTHFNKEQDDDHTVHGSDIMQNMNKSLPLETKKSYSSKYRHSAWKKVAHTIMAFLPIGLMLGAIPPRVIKVNATNHYPAREEVPPAPNSVNRYFKENINSRQALR